MKAIIFNNQRSKLLKRFQSACLRCAYIITDRTASAGNVTEDIFFDNIPHSPSYIQKNKVIEIYCEHTNEPLPEAAQMVSLLKSLAKIKHKNRDQLILEKQLHKRIDDYYFAVVDEMREKMEQDGLVQLRSLVDGKTFGLYEQDADDIELSDKKYLPAAKLLSFDLPDPEQGPELFFLTPEFFTIDFDQRGQLYTFNDKEAGAADKGWLHKCFTLPNINLCTAVELKAIREHLSPAGAEFRKQCAEWMKKCSEGNAENSTRFFRKNVAGHAASLQAAIAQADLIKHIYNAQQNQVKADIWVGEIPFAMLWNFYETMKVIHEPTMQKLREKKKNNPRFAARVPVMILHTTNKGINEKAPQQEETKTPDVQPVKKSISVD